MKYYKVDTLIPDAFDIIQHKGTELSHIGRYTDFSEEGSYLCRQCGLALFRSNMKFASSCGWPSFDENIPKTIIRRLDDDNVRTELVCSRCEGHLGHLFHDEGHTEKNIRFCINSLALDFVPDTAVVDTEEAIVAAGCFWGVQHLMQELPGVIHTETGFTGGSVADPTYEQICSGSTGHVEAVRIIYDPSVITYETILRAFFEMHDPTDVGGQGVNRGSQYEGVIFYFNGAQKDTADMLIKRLRAKNLRAQTQLKVACPFWPAEEEHQHYFKKHPDAPCCHVRTERF